MTDKSAWKLVPIEPTDEMVAAWPRFNKGAGHERAIYAAMLSASPSTPPSAGADAVALEWLDHQITSANKLMKTSAERGDGYSNFAAHDAHKHMTAIRSALTPAPTPVEAVVSLKVMKLSDGRADYFVSIKQGDREVTPHVFREEYKAAYHVALYRWLLCGGEEPDLIAFGPDDWPAIASVPANQTPVEVGGEAITALYTNWRGETAERTFIPHRVFFGSNEWHPEPQVLIEATDCEKGALRTFAAAGFALAKPAPAVEAAWQDISTAPTDGSEVLLYGRGVLGNGGGFYAKARHVGWSQTTKDRAIYWATRDPEVTCEATHWMPLPPKPAALAPAAQAGRFRLGDRVTKTKGSSWTGRVVGTYSTALTPEGYAVESETETGSVQIYPAAALQPAAQAGTVAQEGRGNG